MPQITTNLSFDRETKNTVRFAEDETGQPVEHPGANVIGTLYVQRFAWAALGRPQSITVTIDAAEVTA